MDYNHAAMSPPQEDQIQAKKAFLNHAHLKNPAFALGTKQKADQAKQSAINSFIFTVPASAPPPGASPEEDHDQWLAGLAEDTNPYYDVGHQ